jgi:uncharacterized protein YecA (UPF0149 family)
MTMRINRIGGTPGYDGPWATFPAICQSCGHIYMGLELEPGVTDGIELSNIESVYPCPRCGGVGSIPDGVYSLSKDALEQLKASHASQEALKKFRKIISLGKRENREPEAIVAEIKKEVPELSSVADLLPKKRSELYAFIAMLIGIVTAYLNLATYERGSAPAAPTNINIQQVFTKMCEELSARPPRKLPPRPKKHKNRPCHCGSGQKFKECHGR